MPPCPERARRGWQRASWRPPPSPSCWSRRRLKRRSAPSRRLRHPADRSRPPKRSKWSTRTTPGAPAPACSRSGGPPTLPPRPRTAPSSWPDRTAPSNTATSPTMWVRTSTARARSNPTAEAGPSTPCRRHTSSMPGAPSRPTTPLPATPARRAANAATTPRSCGRRPKRSAAAWRSAPPWGRSGSAATARAATSASQEIAEHRVSPRRSPRCGTFWTYCASYCIV